MVRLLRLLVRTLTNTATYIDNSMLSTQNLTSVR